MSAFTTREIALIRARYPTEGPKALAPLLNRSPGAVSAAARRLGVKFIPYQERNHVWTADEDLILRTQWPRVTRRELSAQALADRLGVSLQQARARAGQLGVRLRKTVSDHPWTEAEEEYLAEHAHLGVVALHQQFLARGWARSQASIRIRLHRLGIRTRCSSEAYSAHGLAHLLGVSKNPVDRWIKKGWLKAKPRTASQVPSNGGPGDQWLIFPRDVARFLREYTAHVDLSRADKFWLVDVLSGRAE